MNKGKEINVDNNGIDEQERLKEEVGLSKRDNFFFFFCSACKKPVTPNTPSSSTDYCSNGWTLLHFHQMVTIKYQISHEYLRRNAVVYSFCITNVNYIDCPTLEL